MGVPLRKVSAFLLDPSQQIKLFSKKIAWMRSGVCAVKQREYMGFQKAPEKRNTNHPAFASLQTQSRKSVLQIPSNNTLIQPQNMWRTLGSRRFLQEIEIITVKSLEMYKNNLKPNL